MPATGTPSQVSPNVADGVPFATPRTRRSSSVSERLSACPRVQLCHDLGAGSGIETSSLKRLDGEKQNRPASPSRHLRYVRLRGRAPVTHRLTPRQVSARFRPRPMTDSPLSARSTALHEPLRRLRGRFTSFRRPQSGETVTKTSGASHSIRSPEAARLRPAKAQHYGARLRLSPRAKQ